MEDIEAEPALDFSRVLEDFKLRNRAQPIEVPNLAINGIMAQSVETGGTGMVYTRHALSSSDPMFHRVAENLASIIEDRAQAVGAQLTIRNAKMVLVVIKPNDVGHVWIDTCATNLKILLRDYNPRAAGAAIFENDIADITGMGFPAVEFGKADRLICLFRENWRFALAFDFNPQKNLNLEQFERTLGSLYRLMRYSDMYAVISNNAQLSRLIAAGWFPFVEIIPEAFQDLARCCQDGTDLAAAEDKLVNAFDDARIDRIFDRWMSRPSMSSRKSLVESALRHFKNRDPIAVIKILLTEIEGILRQHFLSSTGKNMRLKELLKSAVESATRKAGAKDTLLWPEAFAQYLNNYTFAEFNPILGTGEAGSRHAVGHGMAPEETYTQTRALQAIPTLDQITLYL